MLTLGEVIDQQEFGLRLLTGGEPARERAIAGAHNSEMARPAEFVPPDWMLLTLGMKLRGHAEAQRGLIAHLDDAGISALGFGVGVAFRRVPAGLLDEAEKRGFPVFEIPHETPYREIIGYVNRSLLSHDFRVVQRSLSMQNYLMDALREEDPVQTLVQRLGQLLDTTIVLFDAHGAVEAASREVPTEPIWAEVRARGDTSMHRALVDGAAILSIPIDVPERPRRWLAVASRGRVLPTQLVTSVIHSTERLLEMVAQSQRAAAAEDRVRRGELLGAALHRLDADARAGITARLETYGIDFRSPPRLLVVRLASPGTCSMDQLRAAVERALVTAAVQYLTLVRGNELLALTQVDDGQHGSLFETLLEGLPCPALVGIGRPLSSVSDARDALTDAESAAAELAHEGRTGIRRFEELRLSAWLLNNAPESGVRGAVEGTLAPLLGDDQLYRTLVVFLQQNGRVTAAAEALNLHENSLRYRLSRIESLLGRSLRDLPTLADLHLATLAREIGEVPRRDT